MSVTLSGSSRSWLWRATRLALTVLAVILTSGALQAQDTALDETWRWPRFLLASNGDLTRVEPLRPESPSVLSRTVTLDLRDARFGDLIQEVSSQTGANLIYSSDLVSPDRRVSIRAERKPLSGVLSELLHGANVDVVVAGNQVTLVRKSALVRKTPPNQRPGVVTGRVVEKGTDTPVVGAQILLGPVGRAITNAEGRYRITNVEPGKYTVTVVSIGYRGDSRQVEITDGATVIVNFELEAAPTQLSELVVTATGEARRRVEVGNDIVVINADSIVKNEPISSVADLLEGRVPGLVVQRTSGAPGDPTRIRIRGVSSLSLSNDPIIVVDGVRVYSEQSGERGRNLANYGAESHYNAPSPLDYIDPSLIETIQVVKGPSAATMYGQDAANGVIVITTKRGRPGKATWTASVDRGQSRLAGDYPLRYMRLGHSPLAADLRAICPVNGWIAGDPDAGACIPDDSVIVFQALRDPYLTVLDRGQTTSFNVGVSGGVSAFTYSVNAVYRDEVGIVKLSDYEADRFRAVHGREPFDWMKRPQHLTRWGVQSSVRMDVRSNLQVSLSSNVSRMEQQRSEIERNYTALESIYIDKSTGVYNSTSGGLLQPTNVRMSFYERATAKATRFTNALNMNWRPMYWLTITADAGLNVDQRADEIFVPAGFDVSSSYRADGELSLGQGTVVTRTVDIRASSQVPLGLGFMLRMGTGINYRAESIADVQLRTTELAEGVSAITARGANLYGSDRRDSRATFGWYIEPQIAHRRMWLNLGLRFDGGSTFGSNVKLPAFPKINYSYLISEEPFFPELLRSILDELRLRVAYGHAGRQPGPTDRLRLYGAADVTQFGSRSVETVRLQTLGNTNLRPERSREFEGGFEASFLDNRLDLAFTAYRQTTKDALLAVPVAPSVFGENKTQLANIGVTRNEGFEMELGLIPVRNDLVSWTVGLQLSRNRNEVVELGRGIEPFWIVRDNLATGGVNGVRIVPGYPLDGRWSTPVLGYDDANGNGVLEASEVLFGDTAVYVGTTLPEYTASIHNSLSLFRGALSVRAGLTYGKGMTQWDRGYNPELARGWHDPSTTSLFDQLMFYDKSEFTRIQTVNSLRLNSLAVSWQVPRVWAGRFGASSMTLSFQGTNLGLWSNYSGLDPNVNSAMQGEFVADAGVLPEPRTFQFRLNVTY